MGVNGRGVSADKKDPLLSLKKTNSDLTIRKKSLNIMFQKDNEKNNIGMILKKTHSRSILDKK